MACRWRRNRRMIILTSTIIKQSSDYNNHISLSEMLIHVLVSEIEIIVWSTGRWRGILLAVQVARRLDVSYLSGILQTWIKKEIEGIKRPQLRIFFKDAAHWDEPWQKFRCFCIVLMLKTQHLVLPSAKTREGIRRISVELPKLVHEDIT